MSVTLREQLGLCPGCPVGSCTLVPEARRYFERHPYTEQHLCPSAWVLEHGPKEQRRVTCPTCDGEGTVTP